MSRQPDEERPIVFVDAEAEPGGDGSYVKPFRTIHPQPWYLRTWSLIAGKVANAIKK